jgi:hypothetical protein
LLADALQDLGHEVVALDPHELGSHEPDKGGPGETQLGDEA